MNITFIVTRSDTIGGSHIHIRDLGLALQSDGHNVHIIIGGEGPIFNHLLNAGLNVIAVPFLKRNISPLNDIRAYIDIKNTLKTLNPDIVSTHSSKAGFIGRLAASRIGIPVLFTAHGWSFTSGKSAVVQFIFKHLEKVVTPLTNYIITVSDYDKELALCHLSVSKDKIQTIHNGRGDIDPIYFSNPCKDDNGWVNIVQIARFDQQKNQAELLQAVSKIKNIKLHLVGDGPLMNDIRILSEELGIADKVIFYGRIDDVRNVLAKAHIFTLISNWEGFPRSTVEAMRAGLPVVVTNVGGAAEAVEQGVNGFVVEKNDVKGLRKSLIKLIGDSELRADMGRKSRNIYEQKLTFDKMYSKTVSVYKKILSE